MPLYTVHAPPARAGDALSEPMDYVFVKEGFAWPALFIPELWLIFRRMWVVLLIYLAVVLVAMTINRQVGGSVPVIFVVLAHVLFALEGNQLRRWTLARRGYRLVDVAQGGRLFEAEIRFFLDWSQPAEAASPPKSAVAEPAEPSAEAGEVVGLFPSPGGRS